MLKIMNKILITGSRRSEVPRVLEKQILSISRNISKDKGKDEETSKEDLSKMRKGGVIHDKKQSFQEESYFLKEEAEQLKQLKKKMDKDKPADEKKQE